MMIDYDRINNSVGKLSHHLHKHENVLVGVSGGSDSNIIVDLIARYMRDYLSKIHFVFFDTGIEYDATRRHLDFMEREYDIKIERIRPELGHAIPAVVKKKGVPILSKTFSRTVAQAQRGAPSALKKVNGEYMNGAEKSAFNFTPKQKALALYLIEHEIPVSEKCCDWAKKMPLAKYIKEHNIDLDISGVRRAEGGVRSTRYSDCFVPGKDGLDLYMPLYYWNDETKNYYKTTNNVRYSDCYEVWGLQRTGCVGCPFNSRVGDELKIIKQYEPKFYKLCMNLFGESYRLMDQFCVHRHKILEDENSEE